MRPHHQKRLAALVSEFIDGCEFAPPLYVLAIGANGSVSVSRHTHSDLKQICGHNAGRMVSPITVAVVAEDGRGTSAKIEIIEAARRRMQ
jgi:hypothetical protein